MRLPALADALAPASRAGTPRVTTVSALFWSVSVYEDEEDDDDDDEEEGEGKGKMVGEKRRILRKREDQNKCNIKIIKFQRKKSRQVQRGVEKIQS